VAICQEGGEEKYEIIVVDKAGWHGLQCVHAYKQREEDMNVLNYLFHQLAMHDVVYTEPLEREEISQEREENAPDVGKDDGQINERPLDA